MATSETHTAKVTAMTHFVVILLPLLFCPCLLEEAPTPLTIPVRGHHYPVHIGAENHMVQGRISSESLVGELVPSNVIMEGEEDADLRVHLRVEIRDSAYKRPHVYHPDIVVNTTDPLNPQFEHPVIKFVNSSLPYGMEFVVVHTNAFYITEDRYIAVNDFGDLNGDTRIHFDVLLKDKLSETPYVSNSLPFVVEIDYPRVETNPNAALFAGVLILTIVVISLVIPFGVRAKRRHKAGKPICGCGSAEDTSECDSQGSQPEFIKNRAMSIGGKDNLAMMLNHERMMHARPSEDQLHMTFQNRMLRSESSIHFQPQWLDPHLSDYYHRPDFSYLEQQHQQPMDHHHHHYNKHNGTAKTLHPPSPLAVNGKLPGGPSSLTVPAQGSPGNGGGGFATNGNHLNSGVGNNSNARLSVGPPDYMNLVSMRRNSASQGSLNGQQLHPHFVPGQAASAQHGMYVHPSHLGGSASASVSRGNSFNNGSSLPNGLAFFRAPRGTNSNRSSTSSLYHYPANFNQGIEIPMSRVTPTNKGDEEDDNNGGGASASAAGNGATASPSSPTNGNSSNNSGNCGVSNKAFQHDDANQAKDDTPDVQDERL